MRQRQGPPDLAEKKKGNCIRGVQFGDASRRQVTVKIAITTFLFPFSLPQETNVIAGNGVSGRRGAVVTCAYVFLSTRSVCL